MSQGPCMGRSPGLILALPLRCHVTLGNTLHLSEPHVVYMSILLWARSTAMAQRTLAWSLTQLTL